MIVGIVVGYVANIYDILHAGGVLETNTGILRYKTNSDYTELKYLFHAQIRQFDILLDIPFSFIFYAIVSSGQF